MPNIRSRHRGALLGLAVGDAVGTAVEFSPRGSFPLVTDMVGGGPFGLNPGEWTDDTSMALCLAHSLLECDGLDPRDQMKRYVRWWHQGYCSPNDRGCLDIGNTVRAALAQFESTGDAIAGSTDPRRFTTRLSNALHPDRQCEGGRHEGWPGLYRPGDG